MDFADADKVFDGPHLTIEDDRIDYGEVRYLTVGMLEQRMVVLVWTPRGQDLRMISMRKANDREQRAYGPRLAGH
ncbi:BrnT family toxin [Neorhizobium sp. SOG26]|uniref:BrnT family toxin n=1 Tax=Neorhizobium sp. SOG26 TaxID=2060726 RepID=UPI0030EB5054